jgi:DNA helicase-2/ATP-dependent DNA helicase PcrA
MPREYVLERFQSPVTLQIDYARELNPQQLAAVQAPPGPALVIAGAGSGKTRALIYRVAFLLEQGIPAERILLLTFTNKAAREMMRRVADLLGQELAGLWGGTFHSIANRILRQQARLLGFERDFTILDREDARHLISDCRDELPKAATSARFPKADVLAEIFSLAVNTEKSAVQVVREDYEHLLDLAAEIENLQGRYDERKKAANAVDFDDLLLLWLKLLQEHEEAREHYQRRFQFILVDEYQDTNKLQGEIIDLLAARHHNLTVVGDDAQSIYAWRGANYENILKFPKRYPEAKVYKIETNYRSTPEILTVANAAIAFNVHQFSKELAPDRKPGMKPVLVACLDSRQQAAFVAHRILHLREEGTDLKKIAVLYRSHFHALELQLELRRRQIPFTITSGIGFFEQAHIKDVTAYLKLAINPADELAFKRLVKLLPGIGGKGAEKLWRKFLEERGVGSGEQGAGDLSSSIVTLRLQGCAEDVPKKAAVAWAQFVATIAQLEDPELSVSPSKAIELVIEAAYEEHLKANYDNYKSRLEDARELARFARDFESSEQFLAEMALLTNMDAEENEPGGNDDEKVRLSTIHQAKGLEFDVVFVIMLCEGLFPTERSLKVQEIVEEERRLFYVAITRARNELYLSYPLVHESALGPSRFLREIPKDLLEECNLRYA